MRKRLLIAVAVLAILVAGCSSLSLQGANVVRGSSKYVTHEYALDGFTGISVCCAFKVKLAGGNAFKVSVTADDNVIDLLTVRKEGNILRVELDRNKANSLVNARVEAEVTMPALEQVILSGASQLELGGPGPQASNLTLNASGASKVDLSQIAAQQAFVTLSGASTATIKVTGTLTYALTGASQLRYTGGPAIGTSTLNGASSATPF